MYRFRVIRVGKVKWKLLGLLLPSGEQKENQALMGRAAEITTTVACLSEAVVLTS